MYRATKDITLPTTITGSLPRPTWYTENLGSRHFLEAMVTRRFREQYEDAVACYLRDQEIAGFAGVAEHAAADQERRHSAYRSRRPAFVTQTARLTLRPPPPITSDHRWVLCSVGRGDH